MLLYIVLIIIGFGLLVKGGDWLVDGGVAIANRFKLSPMLIGLTIMGFGTSMPELLVSTQAAIAGSPGIAIGNVVGSNIANIALILGLTALLSPVPVKDQTLRIETPFMIIAAMFFCVAGFSGTIQRWMGVLFFAALVVFIVYQASHASQKTSPEPSPEGESHSDAGASHTSLWMGIGKIILSMTMLVIGAKALVAGASDIAMLIGNTIGIPATDMERIIGLTIVAVGTSLPELFASVMAARKGEADMAIGNVVGSVTFNLLCVIGVASIVTPIENSDHGFTLDYLIMLGLTILLWFFMRTKHTLERWEGALMLAVYIFYLGELIIRS